MKISDNAWDVATGVWIGSGRAGNDIGALIGVIVNVVGFIVLLPLGIFQGVFLHWMLTLHMLPLGIAIVDVLCALMLALGIFVVWSGIISRWLSIPFCLLALGAIVESWVVGLAIWLLTPLPH